MRRGLASQPHWRSGVDIMSGRPHSNLPRRELVDLLENADLADGSTGHKNPTMWQGGSPLAITKAVSDSTKPVDSFVALAARLVVERGRNAPAESVECLHGARERSMRVCRYLSKPVSASGLIVLQKSFCTQDQKF